MNIIFHNLPKKSYYNTFYLSLFTLFLYRQEEGNER